MIVVLRAHGPKIIIFVDDHEPARVHVRGDGQAKVALIGSDGLPEVLWSVGMKTSEKRQALKAIREAQAELLEHWRRLHGSDG